MVKIFVSIVFTSLLVFTLSIVSCGKQSSLSVDEYLDVTREIIEAHTESIHLETDSMKDALMLLQRGEIDKGLVIIEVTQHLYAEELIKYRNSWDGISPPREFTNYHDCVSDFFFKLEDNAKLISLYAEELLDGEESDTQKLTEALESREECSDQWDVCSRLAEEALLKTSKKRE